MKTLSFLSRGTRLDHPIVIARISNLRLQSIRWKKSWQKLRSLRTRTEPRDLYDIYYILTNQMVDVEQMSFRLAPKFEVKGLDVRDLRTILGRRQATFQKMWKNRMDGQMPIIPELEDVVRETNRMIQKYF